MTVLVDRVFASKSSPRTYVSPGQRRRFYILLLAVVFLIVCTWAQGRGFVSDLKTMLNPRPVTRTGPKVAMTFPPDGAVGIATDIQLAAEFKNVRGGGLDPDSLRNAGVYLVRTGDQAVVPTSLELAGPARISLKPLGALDTATNYTLYVGGGLKDKTGGKIVPCAVSFATAAPTDPDIRFEKVLLKDAGGAGFTCVAVGPGRMLYASSDDGRIFRFPIEPDGALGKPTVSDVLQKASGGPRLVSGFCFDPTSTAELPILWVCHSFCGFEDVPDWTGRISRISGKELDVCEDVVVNLPRSIRDHLNNQPAFGPDGALYFPQGSNSAFGAPDSGWGDRPERLLTASILRLDTTGVTPGRPLDVRTPDGGGSYDPFAVDAPLTIYARGVRLAYDILWTEAGELYVPVNGSSAGGNAPGGEHLQDISISEDDWLFRILPGRYYGHPNPQQGHFILNGGNPTAKYDFAEIVQYPVGTRPDPKWMPAVYDFGKHASSNGIIEYRSSAFGGKLRGKLLVCRYNVPGDLAVLRIDGSAVTAYPNAIDGLTGFANPLDLTEDPATGNLYVSEYGAQRITLLRPSRR